MVLPPLVLVPGKLAVNPLPRASGITSASLVPCPQACSRLSIFSATHPQQTETAHASLHARDPAQPYDAGIFCCPDANGETNVSELQPPGNAGSKSQQPLCFSPSPADAFRSQNGSDGTPSVGYLRQIKSVVKKFSLLCHSLCDMPNGTGIFSKAR
ncbi:hypothetical protein D623_10034013 [Myotis brandtii]|uniref:Uncharacterized protein n=1 Tax=Myotis brandtii TaxID=109478 RepID=S7PCU1_MYOBR|nr:hypothetical protein D623_10034013 [Myotis brandtii]